MVRSLGHYADTDPAWPKMIQVMLLGLALGALSRRTSVEAAIVAHVALNVVSVLAWPFFEA